MSAEARLKALNLELPPPPKLLGLFKPVVVFGNMAYVSGHAPVKSDGTMLTGRVGEDLDLEAAKDAARMTGLSILVSLKLALGSLDRVKRVIKSLGMVNCTPDFTQHPAVINGFSELFAQVFGDDLGVGARSAVGMGSLPMNIPVEIETILEVEP